jgi:hypothetical protein
VRVPHTDDIAYVYTDSAVGDNSSRDNRVRGQIQVGL